VGGIAKTAVREKSQNTHELDQAKPKTLKHQNIKTPKHFAAMPFTSFQTTPHVAHKQKSTSKSASRPQGGSNVKQDATGYILVSIHSIVSKINSSV